MTTGIQHQQQVAFAQWALSTNAHLESSSDDYVAEVECRAAELDDATATSPPILHQHELSIELE